MLGELAKLNAPPDVLQRLQGSSSDDPQDQPAIDVLYENRRAVEVFLALSSQWRIGPLGGGWIGLEYSSLEATMRMLGVKRIRDTFHKVRVMEGAALAILNRKR